MYTIIKSYDKDMNTFSSKCVLASFRYETSLSCLRNGHCLNLSMVVTRIRKLGKAMLRGRGPRQSCWLSLLSPAMKASISSW